MTDQPSPVFGGSYSPPAGLHDGRAGRSEAGGLAADSAADLQALRRLESILIFLNLGVLGVLIGIHLAFAPFIATPVWLAVTLFAGRFVMQLVELAWLYGRFGQPSAHALRRYALLAVWANVAFACLASFLSGMPHSHYVVLMVLPTIAAAFRSDRLSLVAVVAVAFGVTFVYVGFYQSLATRAERIDEYFEAATDTLTYLTVAIVVRLLVAQLRTEQQRLRRSLAELEQTRDRLVVEEKLAAVGRLSAAIAHEIRNPVGMIACAVANAEQAVNQSSVRDEMYAIVAQESGRLERLTDDFLSFARQAELQRRPTSLRTTLEYLAALIRPRAAGGKVLIAVECAVDQEVLLDAALIHQALLNLAANALEATPVGGTITLGAQSAADGCLELFVTNSGSPIPAEVRARLFEPFFTTKSRGTGLGLAISRKIAREHGGDLQLRQNEPDQVRFGLTLPCAAGETQGQHEVSYGANSDRG